MTRPLSRRSHSPVVRAKVDLGRCWFCTRPLLRGQYICEVKPNEKWGHAGCAKTYCDTINAELDEAMA